MSNIDLAKKIDELHELEELIEEAKANAEAVKDSIKAELLMRNTEELEVNGKIISTHHCTIFQRGAACARSSPMSLL